MIKTEEMNRDILLCKINQIDIDIEGFNNAIINTYDKEETPQTTKDYYLEQISELGLMKLALERLI